MSNIIKFPLKSKKSPIDELPENEENAQESLDKIRNDYIIGLSIFIAEIVDSQLNAAGFSCNDDEDSDEEVFKDEYWVFMVEFIAAMAYYRKGIIHPLHEMIVEYVSSPIDDDEDTQTQEDRKEESNISTDAENIKHNDTD